VASIDGAVTSADLVGWIDQHGQAQA